MTLQGGGVLTNAGSCFLTLPVLQLIPALRGEADFSAQGSALFVPDIPAVGTDHETGILQQLSFLNGTHLDQLTNSVAAHHMEGDVSNLFHIHASTQEHVRQSYWIAVTLIVAGVIFYVSSVLFYPLLFPKLGKNMYSQI
jgi:hypothetical protein